MGYEKKIERYRARVEDALAARLPSPRDVPQKLHEAMRYSALGGGKRIRPLLVYFTGEALDIDASRLDGPACAVELIHAYSLVHDDLPAMDDDDMRRGRPACHRAFDEATAILVGDALQVLAFEILASDPAISDGPAPRLRMIKQLAEASGPAGMAGGQAIDLEAAGHSLTVERLEQMHRLKTGALIKASVLLAALAKPDLEPGRLAHLARYAESAGLAFQIQDDILDVEGDLKTLGKLPGADAAHDKATYPSIVGMDAARARARELYETSLDALTVFGVAAEPLRWISAYIIERKH